MKRSRGFSWVACTSTIIGVSFIVSGALVNAQTPAPVPRTPNAPVATPVPGIVVPQSPVQNNCYVFNTDLRVGSTGADVVALQTWLIAKGFDIAAISLGVQAKGYFGEQTRVALARYQTSVGISPAEGYFGSITRARVNASCGGGTTTGPTVQWSFVSGNIRLDEGMQGVASTSLVGTITLRARAKGGAMIKPKPSDFGIVFAANVSADGRYDPVGAIELVPGPHTTSSFTVSPADATVGDGGEYLVTISGVLRSSYPSLCGFRSMFMAIKDIDSTVGGVTITNQTHGIENFRTPSATMWTGPCNPTNQPSATVQWSFVSGNITSHPGLADVASSSITGTIVLRAKAVGGAMVKPKAADFGVVFASSTQAIGNFYPHNSIPVNLAVSVSPADATVGDGAEYRVTISGTLYSSSPLICTSQSLFMAVKDIDYTVGGVTVTNQMSGLENFYTNSALLAITNRACGSRYITVLSPNRGEIWEAGSSHVIRWATDGLTSQDTVSVSIIDDSAPTSTPLTLNPGGTSAIQGQYLWTIPSNFKAGSKYRVLIFNPRTSTRDLSDEHFTILSSQSECETVTINGITYRLDPCTISASMVDGQGNKGFSTTIKGTGGYGFTVFGYGVGFPTYGILGGTSGGALGDAVLDRLYFNDGVLSANGGQHQIYSGYLPIHVFQGSYSDGHRAILNLRINLTVYPNPSTSQPSITVLSPNGGETWVLGENKTITWRATGMPVDGKLRLNLLDHNKSVLDTLIGPDPFTGRCFFKTESETGNIRDCVDISTGSATSHLPAYLPTGKFYLEVSCFTRTRSYCGSGAVNSNGDVSDGVIYVLASPGSPPPSLRVVSPNGGESLVIGKTYSVKWINSGIAKHDLIRVSLVNETGGSVVISDRLYETNNFDWEIHPNLGPGKYKLRICVLLSPERGCGSTVDESDNYFTLTSSGTSANRPPVIHSMSSPTVLKVGETGTWSLSVSDPENGPLSYSVDWGDTPTTAGALSPASIQQTSTFTHSYSSPGTYKVTFTVTDNGGLRVQSSATVQVMGNVVSPPVVTCPAGYICSPVGVALVCPANHVCTPTIVNCPFGYSCAMFKVIPSVTVLSPNGGETWTWGNTYTIKWNSREYSGNVSIQFMKDGRTACNLGLRPAGTGYITFRVDRSQCSNLTDGLYRLHIAKYDENGFDFNIEDFSDNYFTISTGSPTPTLVPYPYTNPSPSPTPTSYNSGQDWLSALIWQAVREYYETSR